jgi:16S rRNA G966 N2-methylase RsmD
MRWWTRYICPPGGIVLDPFAGSGTAGVAALREGRRAVLIERHPPYAEIIRHRLASFAMPIFEAASDGPPTLPLQQPLFAPEGEAGS